MPSRAAERGRGDARLGEAIRTLRRERGLTLTAVAAQAGLSQPFLSQLELGRARPSMRSLWRIAEALGTTQQALLGGGSDEVAVGAGDTGGARVLMHDPGHSDVTEFVGGPREFEGFFAHGRHELLYVVRGTIEAELVEDGVSRRVVLGERETLDYPGDTPHRFRQVGAATSVVLAVHSG